MQHVLKRSSDDSRLFVADGLGTVRVRGRARRTLAARSGSEHWTFTRRGVWRRVVRATDGGGAVVGDFERRGVHRGDLRWKSQELVMRPSEEQHDRYAVLGPEDEQLILVDARAWGREPIGITVDDRAATSPGLVLFAAFVGWILVEDAAAGAAGIINFGG